MKTIISILEKTSTKQGLLLLTVLYALVFGLIISTISKLTGITGGIGILDFDRGYTHSRVIEVFSSYGEAGMTLYSGIQLLDLINPALYSLLISSLVYLLVRHSKVIWLSIIPLLAGLLDYLENLTLYLLVQSYPDISESLASFSSALSIIKNIALFGTMSALIAGGIVWIKKRSTASENGK